MLTFDIAIQSRVHLALDFPHMDDEAQRAIFRMFLDDLAPSELERERDKIFNWLDHNFDRHAEFSGRQIRNVLCCHRHCQAHGRKLKLADINSLWYRTKRSRISFTIKQSWRKRTRLQVIVDAKDVEGYLAFRYQGFTLRHYGQG